MEPILSREQVRNCDQLAIERYGIAGLVLMENAGAAAGRYILELLGNSRSRKQVKIIAGSGNNGGDGFVVARHLDNAFVNVNVLLCCERCKIKGDALVNLEIIEKLSIPVSQLKARESANIISAIKNYIGSADVVVDAMLGTGVKGPAREPIRSVIKAINDMGTTVVSLDIPSGLDCDTGKPLGETDCTIKAQHTITFAAMKKGFVETQAQEYTGKISVASIGIAIRHLVNS